MQQEGLERGGHVLRGRRFAGNPVLKHKPVPPNLELPGGLLQAVLEPNVIMSSAAISVCEKVEDLLVEMPQKGQ